jgi:hypothetical protein
LPRIHALEGCQKLSARERYRLRQGVYQIVYEVGGLRLTVLGIKIAHRHEVYRASKKKGELSAFTLRFVLRDLIPENTAVE